MLFGVLGPLEVTVEGVPVVLPGPRPRALLTALLLQPNRVVAVSRLIEAVWGEQLPDKVGNALHTTVARLRRTLGPAGEAIVTRPPGYLLVVDESAIDASRFEARCREARSCFAGDPTRAARLLDEALALWRGGPAYGEFAEAFAGPAATRLEELRMSALEDRAELTFRCGSSSEAVASARDLAAEHPLRERPVEVLMRALHAAGRTGEALEVYQRHRELLADEIGLDPSSRLRDLEARILRDDLAAPGVADAPAVPPSPVPSTRPRGSSLPWRPSPLLGREQELHLLLEAVATRRLVTLVGPGGVGKTRLALEAAHCLADAGSPAWWVDLTAVTAERLVDALAAATAVEIQRDTDPPGSLCAALGAHRGVLFMDNAEHLLEPLAPIVERLADAAPDLVVLATSRERLALDAEAVRALAPLALPAGADRENPAVRLFVERAPGLEQHLLTEDDVGLIADLCRRLDGLPLAIELGAARAATLGLRQLGDRLGERLDLLAGGRRTAARRHRTLRAVVGWSHEMLTEDEARLFARLAIFPGAFSLDQVESVCADARLPRGALAPLLARLVEQSLVQAGQGRFWLLETLRAYAWERLEVAGEVPGLRERHALHSAARLAVLASQLWTAHEQEAAAALTELVADLHAAWAYASEHDPMLAVQLAADVSDFAYIRQRLDLLHWGSQVAAWNVDHPSLPRALSAAAQAAWAGGRFDEAWELATRGVAVAGGSQQPAAAHALDVTADLAMFAGRTDDALTRYRDAAELFGTAGEFVRVLMAEIAIAQVLVYAGRSAEARARIEGLLARAHQLGNPTALAWAYTIAGLAEGDNDVDRAHAAYATAVAHGRQVDSRLFVMIANSSSIALAAGSGEPAQALEELSRVLEEWEQLGNEAVQWWVLLHLVVLLARVDAQRDAAVLAGAVIAGRDRQVALAPDQLQFETALGQVRGSLGADATDLALAHGATLTLVAAVKHARQATRAAKRTRNDRR